MAAHVVVVVAVRGIDGLVAGAAQRIASQKTFNQADSRLAVRGPRPAIPVAVPDDVDRHRITWQDRPAVIIDAVAGHDGVAGGCDGGKRVSGHAVFAVWNLVLTGIADALSRDGIDSQKYEQTRRSNSDLSGRKFHIDLTD